MLWISASISKSAPASAIINADADIAQVATRKNFEEATRELSNSHALISSVIPIIQMLGKKLDDYLTISHGFDPIRTNPNLCETDLNLKKWRYYFF